MLTYNVHIARTSFCRIRAYIYSIVRHTVLVKMPDVLSFSGCYSPLYASSDQPHFLTERTLFPSPSTGLWRGMLPDPAFPSVPGSKRLLRRAYLSPFCFSRPCIQGFGARLTDGLHGKIRQKNARKAIPLCHPPLQGSDKRRSIVLLALF